MLKHLIIFWLITLCGSLLAQPTASVGRVAVQWGQRTYYPPYFSYAQRLQLPHATLRWSAGSRIIGHDAAHFYVIHPDGASAIVEQYHRDSLSLRQAVRYLLPSYTESFTADDLVIVKDKLLLFQSAKFLFFNQQIVLLALMREVKTGKAHYFAQPFDKNSFAKNGKPISLGVLDAGFDASNFGYCFSPDSAKVLIYNVVGETNTKTPLRLALRVFDQSFGVLWEKEIVLPYRAALTQLNDAAVDNNGNAYLLATAYQRAVKPVRRGTPNYQLLLLRTDGSPAPPDILPLKDQSLFLQAIKMEVNGAGEVICAGFFAKNRPYQLSGTAFYRTDATGKSWESVRLSHFSLDYLALFKPTKAALRRPWLTQLYTDLLVPRSDGGVVIVGEKRYQNRTQSGTYYHFHEVVVLNLQPDGTIAWCKRIPKRQIDKSGAYSSYTTSITAGQLVICYNDHTANRDRHWSAKSRKFSYSNPKVLTRLTTIDTGGGVMHDEVMRIAGEPTMLVPRATRQLNKQELLFLVEDAESSYFRYAKLFLPN